MCLRKNVSDFFSNQTTLFGITVGTNTPTTTSFTSPYLYTSSIENKDHVKKLHKFSKVIIAVSFFFWSWAAYNTKFKMKTHFDLGIISFFLSGSSSIYLYVKTKNGVNEFTSTGRIGRLLVTMTHIVVVLNYALGAYLACFAGRKIYVSFATYCVLFVFLWSFSAYTCWRLITNTIEIGIDEVEEALIEIGNEYGNDNDDYVYDDYSIDSPKVDGDGVSRRWLY